MSDNDTSGLSLLKNRTAIIVIAAMVLVVLIWLLVFFLPQGKKLSTLSAEEQTLQTQVAAGQARVAVLKQEALSRPKLEARAQALDSYVPSTPGVYTYITTMSVTAAAANVTIASLAPGSPSATTTSGFSDIPFTVSVTGPYDNLLTFIKDIYGLPRLTQINALTISGGGPNTSRSTVLNMTATLTIFTTAKSTAAAP